MRQVKKSDINLLKFLQFTSTRKKKIHQLTIRKFVAANQISQGELRFILIYAYSLDRLWVKYLDQYYDLFISEEAALIKAKSHSLGVICNLIRNTTGCQFGFIYEAVMKEVGDSSIQLDSTILNIESRYDFILSLSELNDTEAS